MKINTITISAVDISVYQYHNDKGRLVEVKRADPAWKITQADRNYFDKIKPKKITIFGLEINTSTYDYADIDFD